MIELILAGLFQVAAGEPAPPPPAEDVVAEETWAEQTEGSSDPAAEGEIRYKRACYYERNSSWRFRMQRCEVEEVHPGDPGYDEASATPEEARRQGGG